ncbi:hypothetical protein J2129_002779 [Methanofollis sp. W23]|uniref:hypothetical protein n=1 Tax=Methanofollis sp. W23 TaxID=2817849 RepID=UPI001AE6178F|nr:hypothetical protein [Methanofollis sp. W23]MBP2147266.1 hypothetical protein [Methanofollis sp. W23]
MSRFTKIFEGKTYEFAGAYGPYKDRAREEAEWLESIGQEAVLEEYPRASNGEPHWRLWRRPKGEGRLISCPHCDGTGQVWQTPGETGGPNP